ncbi:hypothetical protein EMIT0P228_20576 [Pseudomonas brassicacearum]
MRTCRQANLNDLADLSKSARLFKGSPAWFKCMQALSLRESSKASLANNGRGAVAKGDECFLQFITQT